MLLFFFLLGCNEHLRKEHASTFKNIPTVRLPDLGRICVGARSRAAASVNTRGIGCNLAEQPGGGTRLIGPTVHIR